MGWVVFVGLALVLVDVLSAHRSTRPAAAPPTPAAVDPLFRLIVPFIPWGLVVVFLYLVVFRPMRKARLGQDTALLRPMALDVSADAVTVTNGPVQTRWQWEAFDAHAETDAQFVLFLAGENRWLGLPKRLAADPADLAAVRDMIADRVRPPVGAFPVLPVGGGGLG